MDRLKREANPPVGQLASPIPQYKRPGSTDYDPVEGQHGAPFATLKDASGNVVSPATEDKLEQARVLLNTISTKDFATQTTLAAVLAKLEQLETEIQAVKANQVSGDQKVTLSGTNVLLAEGNTVVAASAIASVATDVFVADVREVYAYAGKAQANTPWKMEIRFMSNWPAGSGWDANVSYQDYVVDGTSKNAYIEPVKCVSSTVRLIIQNNHTEDMTFRWRLGGLR